MAESIPSEANPVQQGRIFINYRRDDSEYPAGWLHDLLAERFGRDQVFKDLDSIEPGDDFTEVINGAVASCDVLLALIGDRWLTGTGPDGGRRLDDPHDFVALEIEAALSRQIRVIPILIGGTTMPSAADLPVRLAQLANRQSLELSPSRFDTDTQRLIAVLETTLQQREPHASPAGGGTRVDSLVPPPPMVGRGGELARLRAVAEESAVAASPVVIIAIHGMGGAGKTALARALAAEIADRFTDGRIEVDLCGYTPGLTPRLPLDALGDQLGLVGFGAAEIPATIEGRSELWRSWLSDRRVLLVLDNARDETQVLPLLPGGRAPGHCLVVVTSRTRLSGLDTALNLGIDTLPEEDAVTLLLRTGRRSSAESGSTRAELALLSQACGRLPLALRSVGSMLDRLEPAELIEIMHAGQAPFEHLPLAGQATSAAFAASYDALAAPLQAALRACAWHPGPDFDPASIAALTGDPRTLVTAQLADLLHANMLTGVLQRRYSFHDLFLGYTRQRAESEDDELAVGSARHQLFTNLQERLDTASSFVYSDNRRATGLPDGQRHFSDTEQARLWLVAAANELTTAAHVAQAERWPGATRLGETLAYWLHAGGRSAQADTLYQGLLEAARSSADLGAQARALQGLGMVAYAGRELDTARDAYREAQELCVRTADRQGEADALKGLGDAARGQNDRRQAEAAYRSAFDLYDELDDRRGQVDVLIGRADVAFTNDDPAAATSEYREAHDLAERIAYRSGQADALCGLADVAAANGDVEQADAAYGQAQEIYREIGNRHGLAYALKGLGDVALLTGANDRAGDLYTRARSLYQQIGFPNWEAEILRGMADVALATGSEAEAREHLLQALVLNREIRHDRGAAAVLATLEALARNSGDDEQAQEFAEQARALTGE